MSKIVEWKNIEDAVARRLVFDPLRHFIEGFGGEWPELDDYNQLFKSCCPEFPFVFVPQASSLRSKKTEGSLKSYIAGVGERGEIATRRHNVHDLFNFLTYVLFPKTKGRIMQLHLDESLRMEPARSGGRGRTRLQDLLTLFDEGGAIFQNIASPQCIVFGHGIYEQAVLNPKPVRAMAWQRWAGAELLPNSPSVEVSDIDTELANDLEPARLVDSKYFVGQWIPDRLLGL